MGGGTIFLVLLIAIGVAFGGFVSIPKGENQVVIRTAILLAITCCWLMCVFAPLLPCFGSDRSSTDNERMTFYRWAITYLAQLHPLISAFLTNSAVAAVPHPPSPSRSGRNGWSQLCKLED